MSDHHLQLDDDFWEFDDTPPAPAAATISQTVAPSQTFSRVPRPKGHPFRTEVDLGEIDERMRPSAPWTARTLELSRGHLVLLSRRMVYTGRKMLISVHLIDSKPTPLAGVVVSCDYDADGLYKIDLDLVPVPRDDTSLRWFAACWKK
ncbi:MAG: hypothetical protein KF866_02135 [Phycisphaeraceae bacterium]|nr:hypothetical protein [Phycisphaeraceae bacterium]MCW5753508.1 hypothetical protein [Phycisphaeraceae bacterium]